MTMFRTFSPSLFTPLLSSSSAQSSGCGARSMLIMSRGGDHPSAAPSLCTFQAVPSSHSDSKLTIDGTISSGAMEPDCGNNHRNDYHQDHHYHPKNVLIKNVNQSPSRLPCRPKHASLRANVCQSSLGALPPLARSPFLSHVRAFSISASCLSVSPGLQQIEIQDYIASLDEEGRRILAQELKAAEEVEAALVAEAADSADVQRPSATQLRYFCLYSMVPFIGFGFLDNALMIIFGDYIDTTIGVAFGISTMAAAGLGNLFSDLAGLGCAHYIETLALKLGLRAPKMSVKQKEMGITRFAGNFGRAVGVTIGCLLGMFPLLFLGGREEVEAEAEAAAAENTDGEVGGMKKTLLAEVESVGESGIATAAVAEAPLSTSSDLHPVTSK